jgi:DNA topoisomerase-1
MKEEEFLEAAEEAGLTYVTDRMPGITRETTNEGFRYFDPRGRLIERPRVLDRIRHLAIPPAYRNVWIGPKPNGHLQATGKDAKGRKQYRYHPRFREVREEANFHRMAAFCDALPTIRSRVKSDLSRRGLPRERELAAVVHLLETSLIRVGNSEYAKQNHSFGLTTLHNEHVEVHGSELRFHFSERARWSTKCVYATQDSRN